MQKPYTNQLSLNHEPKGVPYGGLGEIRGDGDANYGFKDIKGNNALLLEIPELKRDHGLMSLVHAINAPHTGLFSVGCVSGPVEDEYGFRHTGYVEFSVNSVSAIADAGNYFPLFFHFDRMLNEGKFSGKVAFDWELQPVIFIDANADGFTCSITVNTHYSKTKEEAEAAWLEAIGVLEYFLGSIPRGHNDLIFGQ
jgi:hypothetical protein